MFLVPDVTQTKLIFSVKTLKVPFNFLLTSRNIKQILSTLLTPIIKEAILLQELTVKNGVAIPNSKCKTSNYKRTWMVSPR